MDKTGRKINNSTVIVGDFISPFSGMGMDRTKQKINKEIEDFNTNELDVTNTYKTLHQHQQNIYLSQVHKWDILQSVSYNTP